MKKNLLLILLLMFLLNQFISAQFSSSSFKTRVDLAAMPLRPGSLAVGDLTGDGLPEFLVGGEWQRKIMIFNNQSTAGNLSFPSNISFPTDFSDGTKTDGIFNNSLKIVDINGDGLKDIVMSGYWNGGMINGAGPNQPGIINIYLNKGSSTVPSFDVIADKSILANDYDDQNDGNTFIDVADINGDGKPDIAAKRTWSAGQIAFLNTSQGGILSFGAGIPINGGKSAWKDGIRIIDMDEDGVNDIIGLAETQVWLAKNTGNTFPESSVEYDVPVPNYMDIADIDNDGDNDYLVVSKNNIVVGVNDHTQTDLAAKFPHTFIDNAGTGDLKQLAFGDLDKDGKLDLAVTQSNGSELPGNLQLYKNTSTLNNVSFAGFAGYPVLKDPGAVRIVDFDGDGKLDIIVHHFLNGQDAVSIFLNNMDIPGIATITPAIAGAGEQLVLSGSAFTGATKVIFTGTSENEVLATNFTVGAEGKTITLIVPSGAKTGKLKITTASGTYFQEPVFSFVRPVPLIDGIADALWNAIPTEEVTHMVSNYPVAYDAADLSGSFKAYWTTDALYILGKVKDDILVPPTPSMAGEWNNDYFEVYIDGDNSKNIIPDGSAWDKTAYDNNDSQMRFVYATDSVSGGNGWIVSNKAAKHQVVIKEVDDVDKHGYTIEIKIPWTAMGATPILPKTGMKIGFDIVLADNDGTGRDREMGWKTFYDQIYQNPSMFGTFELLENGTLLSHNDNEKPSDLTGLTAVPAGNSVTLTWNASTDNVGVTAYKVFDGTGTQILSTTDTKTTISKLKFNSTYSYLVLAVDQAYNQSVGAGIEVQTQTDAEAPTSPGNFIAVKTNLSVKLTWTASTDNDKVLNYKIYQNDVLIKTTTAASLVINSLANNKTYKFSIVATDPSGNISIPAVAEVIIGTGIEEISSGFTIYPNPVTDQLTVNSTNSITSIRIISMSGNTMFVENKNMGNQTEINTSFLSKGLYFIKISTSAENEYVRKFIRQ